MQLTKREIEILELLSKDLTKKIVPQAPFFRYGDKELALYR
jgi:hypothetical protein